MTAGSRDHPVELSLSEAGALAFKACRGAGLDWGVAEEGRWAVTAIHSRGLPGLDALLAVLEAGLAPLPGEARAGAPAILSVLHAGTALSDLGRIAPEGVHLDAVAGPLLIVPFVAQLPGVHSVQWHTAENSVQVTVRRNGDDWALWGGADVEAGAEAGRLSITPLSEAPASQPIGCATRALVSPARKARLEAFAARTYAPATEASRARGAGER